MTALTACQTTSPTGSTARISGRIVVLGDSLAVSPSRSEAFPAVLQESLREASLPWTVVNAGVRGDTTGEGLQRLDRVLQERPDILVLALGANDALRATVPATMSRNLDAIIARARGAGASVLLCGTQLPDVPGWNYGRALRDVFLNLAGEHNIPLVPYLLDGVAMNPAMNGPDYIHPNAAGARRIADNVWRYLEPMVRAAASP